MLFQTRFLLAVVATAFGLTTVSTAAADDYMAALTASNNAFAKAIMAGDIDYLVNDYTPDGCIIAPSAPNTCGAEPIRAFWTAVIASKPQNVEILTRKAGGEGPLGYTTGDLRITDAEGKLHESRFVLVFKKIDGAWKLHVDSWTPN